MSSLFPYFAVISYLIESLTAVLSAAADLTTEVESDALGSFEPPPQLVNTIPHTMRAAKRKDNFFIMLIF
jgi:hypothetical protein